MRLVYVTSSFPFGPGEGFILPELESLLKMGHELLVVPLRPRGSIVHEEARQWFPRALVAPLVSVEILKAFVAIDRQPLGTVSRNLFGTKVPVITVKNMASLPKSAWLARHVAEWGADHIHAFWASTVATLAMSTAELSGIPWSFTAHRFDIVQNNLLRQKAESAQFVRFISESGLRMSGLLGTNLRDKTKVVHLGVELRDVTQGLHRDKATIALCAASFIPVKAHAVLIEAVDLLRRRGIALELWLAGEGELQHRLQLEVHERSLEERVKFLGGLSHSALMNLYATGAVDIAVLASADLGHGLHEGIPASLMEAMSFGVPAIGTKTGGIPELLGHGAGLLVPPNVPFALADALQLLAQNNRLRESIGRAGQRRIRESFNAVNIATEMTRLFAHDVGIPLSHAM